MVLSTGETWKAAMIDRVGVENTNDRSRQLIHEPLQPALPKKWPAPI
jgi:hypothetical protein